mmetsp:Transcript_24613/g.24207  ORF Transcript_24613/g.24207 Transcript_24613/m.24207 type:complete len:109 (+) Transcript_24613:904-1230(+)
MSGGSVRLNKKDFSSIKNDLCITFDKNSEIIEVSDDDTIDQLAYCFSSLADVQNNTRKRVVDVIGILQSIGTVVEIPSKLQKDSKRHKRTVTITDESCLTIQCVRLMF